MRPNSSWPARLPSIASSRVSMRGNSSRSAPPEKLPGLPVITSDENWLSSSSASNWASDSSAPRPRMFGRPSRVPSSIVTSATESRRSRRNSVTGSATQGGYLPDSVRLLVATAAVLLTACACGEGKARVTEADVQMSSPVPVGAVFEMSRRHHVELTQVVSTDVGKDHHTEGVMVTSDMDAPDVAGSSGGEFAVDHFFATGSADDLRALRREAGVEGVLLKEEVLERVRRAREGR